MLLEDSRKLQDQVILLNIKDLMILGKVICQKEIYLIIKFRHNMLNWYQILKFKAI